MSTTQGASLLDRFLDPLARSLTPEVATRLIELRADPDFQARLDLLADKCTEGERTPEEHREYDTYVHAVQLLGILQAKARQLLAVQPSP